MQEKKHIITAAALAILVLGTGAAAYFIGYQGNAPLVVHDFKTPNGACHVKGTVRNFEVICDKNIQHINYLNMQSRYLTYFGPGADGSQENLEMIVVNLNKVKGSDKNKNQLSFSLTHNDDSITEISLK